MFEKDADYRKARKESRDNFTKVIKVWSAREVALHNEGFKDGAEFGYNKAKEETEYARTIIQDLLDNSDEYARQRAYEFLDRPCATCRHKAKMLTDKKPCKDCDNGCNWEK